MKCEEILSVVDRVWNSENDSAAISKGQMSHHQVIAVALEMKGDNVYLRTKGGLDVGIKNTFIPNREQNGVEIIISNVQNETDEEYELPLNKNLKYNIPEIKNLKKFYLTDEEVDFFSRTHGLFQTKW